MPLVLSLAQALPIRLVEILNLFTLNFKSMFFRKKCRPLAVVQSEPVLEHVSFQQDNVVMIKDVPNSSIELPDRELFTLENQLKSGMSMPKVNPTVLSPFDSDAEVVLNSAIADDVDSTHVDKASIESNVEPSNSIENEN